MVVRKGICQILSNVQVVLVGANQKSKLGYLVYGLQREH